MPAVDFFENGGDRADRNVLHGLAEFCNRGEVAVAVLGSQTGHAQGALERPRATHQLTEDQPQGLDGQWPLAGRQGPRDDLVLAGRRPDFQSLMMLDLSDLEAISALRLSKVTSS